MASSFGKFILHTRADDKDNKQTKNPSLVVSMKCCQNVFQSLNDVIGPATNVNALMRQVIYFFFPLRCIH